MKLPELWGKVQAQLKLAASNFGGDVPEEFQEYLANNELELAWNVLNDLEKQSSQFQAALGQAAELMKLPEEKAIRNARKRVLRCGYASKEALAEIDRLEKEDPETIKLLAAMAITHHDSAWSDSQRDLYRGTTEVLGRQCYWDKRAEEK